MEDRILPDFDERGCLPDGIYNPSVQEFKERFVKKTKRRQELFEKYKEFIKLCDKANMIEQHYLDGSYVTSKEEPGDIDLIVIYTPEVYDTNESYDEYFKIYNDKDEMKKKYEVHLFFVKKPSKIDPIDVQKHYQKIKNKYLEWWSRVYIDREKGIQDTKKKGFIVFNKEELQLIGG